MTSPYMPLYVADYIGDTQHLTTEQHGAYLLILMAMWRNGGRLPNDPHKLARIARVSPKRWAQVSPDVMEFFTVDGGDITQKRLEQEHQKALSISRKRSLAGAKGYSAKALKNNEQAQANAQAELKHRARVPESGLDIVVVDTRMQVQAREGQDTGAAADVAAEIQAEATRLWPGSAPLQGAARVRAWLAAGHDPEIIRTAAAAALAKRHRTQATGPPHAFGWFDQAIADAAAAATRPLPEPSHEHPRSPRSAKPDALTAAIHQVFGRDDPQSRGAVLPADVAGGPRLDLPAPRGDRRPGRRPP